MNAATLRRAPRVIIAAASGLAIAVPLTVAAPSAQAAGTLTGPSSAGVSQSVTTLSSAYEGLVDLIDIANNRPRCLLRQRHLAPRPFLSSSPAPSAPTTMVLSAIQNGKPLSSNNLTLTVGTIGTTTTISAPNTAKVGTATKITVTVTSSNGSQYNPPGQVIVKDTTGATIQTMGLTDGPGAGQSYAYWRWTPAKAIHASLRRMCPRQVRMPLPVLQLRMRLSPVPLVEQSP